MMNQETCILVSASPLKTQSHLTAIRYVETLFDLNFQVSNLFFYQDAVLVANRYNLPPSDEPQIRDAWINLVRDTNIELQICVAASLRRGVMDKSLAKEHQLSSSSADQFFTMAGLGQLAAAMSDENKNFIHFK